MTSFVNIPSSNHTVILGYIGEKNAWKNGSNFKVKREWKRRKVKYLVREDKKVFHPHKEVAIGGEWMGSMGDYIVCVYDVPFSRMKCLPSARDN